MLNKKQLMFMELIHSVEKLIGFNDQHIKNEAEKMQLQARVDTNSLELQQLRVLASELESDLERKKDIYKSLKQGIREQEQKQEALNAQLDECQDELE